MFVEWPSRCQQPIFTCFSVQSFAFDPKDKKRNNSTLFKKSYQASSAKALDRGVAKVPEISLEISLRR